MSGLKLNLVKLATGRRLFALIAANRQTLWLAGDHLLLQISTGYTERTRRFYFADIQSIVYARTNTGAVFNMVCAAVAALLLFLGLWSVSDVGMYGASFIIAMALLPLLVLVVNLVLGPTCACVLSTAVHTERVIALNRLAKVQRVLEQILPRIDAAQGRLSADMLAADQPETDSVEAGRHALEGGPVKVELRQDRGRAHLALFLLLVVYACSHAVDLFIYSSTKNYLDFVLFFTLIVLSTTLIIWQRNGNLPAGIKVLPQVALAGCALEFMILMLLGAAGIFPDGAPPDTLGTQLFLLVSGTVFLAPGILGLLRMKGLRQAAPPHLPERLDDGL